MIYPDVSLFIDGSWSVAGAGAAIDVLNPATGDRIGVVAKATRADLDHALAAADRAFKTWSKISAFERYKIMRKSAEVLRARADAIAEIMTIEQGKPLAQSKLETLNGADIIDWCAEEGRRAYGRLVPARADGVRQMVVKTPVGPVAAFTPWNFPINQAVRKIAAALAAGCVIIIKGPEETPASCAELVRAFADGGVPSGVINLVFGVPSEISEHLIPNPVIRKVSFTGSTAVGKRLAMLAGEHMKRITMELGGHAPALVFDDADLDAAVKQLASGKYRNAGQICVAPTRFLVQEKAYAPFLEKFVDAAKAIKVGDGLDPETTMGPLAHLRRVEAMEAFVADALSHGAKLCAGGKRIGNKGFFFEPTVLADVPNSARTMNEEPFGPLAIINRFDDYEEAVTEANRLDYGLAAYAYTKSARTMNKLGGAIESGMVSINHLGLGLPEIPFGGIKDSGFGSEGGAEALEAFFNTKLVTQFED
ncbi:NAD-dependent succinate-semialdehyde dehydrogenase [Methylocapsa sp. S129]|uniref:NAD-dependent succinate-semialdehyde dehydrogenase n=1 Tax=Methylocapsa sp. S129 TaxID=1641869 RepID=UPI001AEDD66B|nr:NAD-dependent succinate-semialdehyde dehydrogenase [Methylocapsa sp. S129]